MVTATLLVIAFLLYRINKKLNPRSDGRSKTTNAPTSSTSSEGRF